jgi:DNA-binding CsgD family transcriptional regulator
MQSPDSLIASIYRAADPETGWHAAVEAIVATLGGTQSALQLSDPANSATTSILAAHGTTADEISLYVTHFHGLDPFAAMGRRYTSGRALKSSDFYHPRDIERTEYWTDFAARHGRGFNLIGASNGMVGDELALMGVLRPKGAPDFTENERRQLEGLLPHIRNALGLWNRLRAAQSDTSQAMLMRDALGACVVCDGEGRLSLASPAAEALAVLAGIRLTEDHIAFDHPRLQAGMMALVARTAAGGPGGTRMVAPNAPGGAIIAHVGRLPRHDAPDAGPPHRVLLELRVVQPQAPSVASLRAMFGLGEAEAEVALLLADGLEVEAVAARRGTGFTTVRTQIRAVLAKTGTSSLRELLALLLSMGRPRGD